MPPASAARPPPEIPALRARLGGKIALMLGLTVGICGPYFFLQGIEGLPPGQVPELEIDRAIAFSPGWTPVYLSLAALVPVSILLARRRADLVAFAWSLGGLCLVHYAGFLFFPAAGPRPAPAEIAGLAGSYAWLVSVDGARNAFPSLHAALTVFCMGFALRVSGANRLTRKLGIGWGGAILYATLATKQHFFLDILVGGLLGAAAHLSATRLADRSAH